MPRAPSSLRPSASSSDRAHAGAVIAVTAPNSGSLRREFPGHRVAPQEGAAMSKQSHQTAKLGRGKHASPEDGVCVMELASMLAGEPFGDQPRAVCPVIGAVLRPYNDSVDDTRRQDLYAYAAKIVSTRGDRKTTRLRARTAP